MWEALLKMGSAAAENSGNLLKWAWRGERAAQDAEVIVETAKDGSKVFKSAKTGWTLTEDGERIYKDSARIRKGAAIITGVGVAGHMGAGQAVKGAAGWVGDGLHKFGADVSGDKSEEDKSPSFWSQLGDGIKSFLNNLTFGAGSVAGAGLLGIAGFFLGGPMGAAVGALIGGLSGQPVMNSITAQSTVDAGTSAPPGGTQVASTQQPSGGSQPEITPPTGIPAKTQQRGPNQPSQPSVSS